MKRLRLFFVAPILSLTLTLSAFAGDINCGIVSPPPEQTSTTSETTVVATIDETSSDELLVIDPVTGLALDILQSFLSLF